MKQKMTKKELIYEASAALSDLNTFYVVISILEGGHVHSNSDRAAQRIITICHSESQKRLKNYDRAVEKLLKQIVTSSSGTR